MPRLARLIVPGVAHHLTQRGNRRQIVFFSDSDKSLYLKLLADMLAESHIRLLAYCLMTNHVHLVAVPEEKAEFTSALGELHRKYTTIVNFRERWRGHLWQGRFWSFPLDDVCLYRAVRYIERNPVRAGIVKRAGQYPWSSARGHLGERDDPLLAKTQGPPLIEDWAAYLAEPEEEKFGDLIHQNQRTGRPMGSDEFIARLEAATGLVLRKRRPGPEPGSKHSKGGPAALLGADGKSLGKPGPRGQGTAGSGAKKAGDRGSGERSGGDSSGEA
jgi:putative transposase